MANGEHEQDLGKTSGEGESSRALSREIPDYGRILRKVLEGLDPIDPNQPVLRRGDHLGSRGRPDMHVDWAIADPKDQLPPRVVKVEPSMVTDLGDVGVNMTTWVDNWCYVVGDVQINLPNARMQYAQEKPQEMKDGGCVDSKGCDEVTIQHIPSVGPISRSYGTIGRGFPYLDTPGYEEIPGQSISQPNSVEIDDK